MAGKENRELNADPIPVSKWRDESKYAFRDIESLDCLKRMIWYYRRVRATIRHLTDDPKYSEDGHLARLTFDQVRQLRRYINTDLHNYSIEFYLQHVTWAMDGGPPPRDGKELHPARDPSKMRRGFSRIANSSDPGKYNYEKFLADTLPFFSAQHAHLVSINRAMGDLHYYATELPFGAFTDVGKREIRHLSEALDQIMTGLMCAAHLQPRKDGESDLVSYLVSCRTDCQRFFESIPRYYQSHRLRLVIFPIDPLAEGNDPELAKAPHQYPIACLPWSAGVYLDFLNSYRMIAQHVMAVIHWSIRLYSLWYFVPRRVLRVISPVLR